MPPEKIKRAAWRQISPSLERPDFKPPMYVSNQKLTRGRRRMRASTLAFAAIVGLAAAFSTLLAATIFARRSALPALSEADLQTAEERWRDEGPADYEMLVRVTGRQPSVFRVRVRRGQPVSLTRNGNATQKRMWDVWTVEGLFDTIHQEIELARDPGGPFGSAPGTQVVERAAFDERFGYPRKYQRIVMGTPLEIAWEVVEFRVMVTKGGKTDEPRGVAE